VSETDGIPTGSIFQNDVNASGEYEKFANGRLICTFNVTSSSSADTVRVLPAEFIDTDYRVSGAVINGSSLAAASIIIKSKTTTGLTFNVVNSAGSRVAYNVDITLMGRWF
jgi:hypothetical protein